MVLLRDRKSFFHILLEREDWKFLKKVQNGWLYGTFENRSQSSLTHEK